MKTDLTIADLGPDKMLYLWKESMRVLEEGLSSPDERIRVTCAKHLEALGRRVLSADAAGGKRVKPAGVSAREAGEKLRVIDGGKAG